MLKVVLWRIIIFTPCFLIVSIRETTCEGEGGIPGFGSINPTICKLNLFAK